MVVVGEETRAFACITAPKKTISEPLQTQDIPGTVSLAFVPWKARESALLRGSPLCESVQTRSLQLPLVSLFFFRPPIRGHLEQDTLAPLTRAPPPWPLRSRDLSYFSAADAARSDKGWGGRSRLPGMPPPQTGAARRAPQLRAGPPARPPAGHRGHQPPRSPAVGRW